MIEILVPSFFLPLIVISLFLFQFKKEILRKELEIILGGFFWYLFRIEDLCGILFSCRDLLGIPPNLFILNYI